MKPCFLYLRVSGLSQIEGEGFPRQQSACEAYAKANGYEIVKVFREEGVSGKNELDNRPALRELIAELLSNGVTTVIVEKLDRFARSLMVQETIIQDLQRRGVTLLSAAEPDIMSDDPTRTMIRQILGAFFEYERKMIVSKLADARRRIKKRTGKCEGVKSFGHNEDERRTLEIMIGLRAEGMKYSRIAKHLNYVGYSSRSGKPWSTGTVGKILARKDTR